MTRRSVTRALLSVWDKPAVVPLAARLTRAGVTIVASEGTAAALAASGIAAASVAEITGQTPLLGGRVKTLHPVVAAGILADRADPQHMAELLKEGIDPIDLVVVDLYPFLAEEGGDRNERIDIGGVTLLRAAAKNREWVGAVSSSEQYEVVASEVEEGGLSESLRRSLAEEAFFRTAAFDASVLEWLSNAELPERIVLAMRRVDHLRYGENPQQRAASYAAEGTAPWWEQTQQLQGKALSYNNCLDAEAAWSLVNAFSEPAAVIVKHTNPCGAAVAADLRQAFRAAWEGDPLASYGSVVALNRPLGEDTAAEMASRFIELVLAPEVASDAAAALSDKKALRILVAPTPGVAGRQLRSFDEGFLLQDVDRVEGGDWRQVGQRAAGEEELRDLQFAWTVAASAASNALVVARDGSAVGIGAGDQSRIGAAERALAQAGDRSAGAVAASDGFLPFRDTVDRLAEAGVTALVEPGGSKRDDEVIEAADARGMALMFTGRRHFRH